MQQIETFRHMISPENWLAWRRQPEPHDELEEAGEYNDLAENSFKESDEAFARELSYKIPRDFKGPVIDVGSGPGNITIPLAKLRPDLQFVCLDLNREMLEFAKKRAEKEGIEKDRVHFVQGDMTTTVIDADEEHGAFVFSNTALHELPDKNAFKKTIAQIAGLVGKNGGCFLRDLLLPKNAAVAKKWRAEVVDDKKLSPRELTLFTNSQHAGFTYEDVSEAIGATTLGQRGGLLSHPGPQKSRYWMYEVQPPLSNP